MWLFRFAPLCALLLFALPASAQTRIGIGVRIAGAEGNTGLRVRRAVASEAVDVRPSTSTFVVSIDMPGVRIEPEFGISRISKTEQFGSALPGGEVDFTITHALLGVGVFARQEPVDRLHMLYGARLRYSTFTQSQTDNGRVFDTSGNIYIIGPFVGGEVELSSRFTVGAEAGLTYSRFLGDLFVGSDGDKAYSLNTQTGVFARFFF